MHCSSAAARSACMHAHNSSSIECRPQFGSLTRSWIWIRALRMAFSSSLELGYVLLGLFFPFPNSLSTWQVRLRSLIVADNDRRSHLPGAVSRNHVEHSFRKARQLWTLSKLPSPCHYFEKRKKKQQGQSFSAPNRQSVLFMLPHQPARAVCTCCLHVLSELGRGAASFLATGSTGTVLMPRLMTRIAGHGEVPVEIYISPCGKGFLETKTFLS